MKSRLEALMDSAWPHIDKAVMKGLGAAADRPIAKLIPSRQLDPSVWKAIPDYASGAISWTADDAWRRPRVDRCERSLSADQLRRVEHDDDVTAEIEAWAKQAVNDQERLAMSVLCRSDPGDHQGTLEDQLREYRNRNMAALGPFVVAAKPDAIAADIHGVTVVTVAVEHFGDNIDAVVIPKMSKGLRIEWGHNLELAWTPTQTGEVCLLLEARYRFAGNVGSEHVIRVRRRGRGEIYQRGDGKHGFRIIAGNGEIVADGGQGYVDKADARTTLENVMRGHYDGPISDV